MPPCCGKVMAIQGGRSNFLRSICPQGVSSLHQRGNRTRAGLGLRNRGVQSTETWSVFTAFRASPLLKCRAVGEQEEQFYGEREQRDANDDSSERSESMPNSETELVQGNEAPSVATGSVLGAMALITGNSVGAGILALPAVTAPIGFIPSVTMMGLCWAFLVAEALLLAEVNVALMRRRSSQSLGLHGLQQQQQQQQHSHVVSLRTMAEETLGPVGGWLAAVIYLMLSYTLLVAYISKSGEILALLLGTNNRAVGDFIFTVVMGAFSVAGAVVAEGVNQVLTVLLLGLFLLIVFGGATMADWTGLQYLDWTQAPQTLPIIFLALVYHDLTPVVCAQLGGDMGRIRISIVLGSFIPLVMFLSWDAVALCVAPILGGKDPIEVFMRAGGPGPAIIVESFAFLAVATSFIGTVLGLSEFFLEQFGKAQEMTTKRLPNPRQSARPLFQWLGSNGPRAISSLLVLAPPLVASSLVSDAFFSASDLAGAYGMTSLYGVIPPIMAWRLQNSNLADNPPTPTQSSSTEALKPPPTTSFLGDKVALATMSACAVAVIVGQVLIDLPQLSSSAPVSPVAVAKVVEVQENLPPSNNGIAITQSVLLQPFTTLAAP